MCGVLLLCNYAECQTRVTQRQSSRVFTNNPEQTSSLLSIYWYKNIPKTLRKLHDKYF